MPGKLTAAMWTCGFFLAYFALQTAGHSQQDGLKTDIVIARMRNVRADLVQESTGTEKSLSRQDYDLVGILRIKEAAGVLAEDISWHRDAQETVKPLGEYPAALALVRIGKPGADAVIARMSKELDKKSMELCVSVLLVVEKGLASKRLENEYAEALENRWKTRMKNLRNALDNLEAVRREQRAL